MRGRGAADIDGFVVLTQMTVDGRDDLLLLTVVVGCSRRSMAVDGRDERLPLTGVVAVCKRGDGASVAEPESRDPQAGPD